MTTCKREPTHGFLTEGHDMRARLEALARELVALKEDATKWLTDRAYAALRHRLEAANAAAEAALVEARRRVRLNEER